MSSDLEAHEIPPPRGPALRPRLRRAVPWMMWGAALVAVVWLGASVGGTAVAPGMAEIRQVTLTSPTDAKVATVQVAPGDRVESGARVVRLESVTLDAELAVARAELERLKLEIVAQGVSLQGEATQVAERLSGEAEQAALTVAQLEADEQRDRSELVQLDEQIARQERLVAQKLAAADALNGLKLRRAALAREVSEYRRTLRQARAHLNAANQRRAAQRDGASGEPSERSEAADTESDALSRQLAPHRAAVKAQEERVTQLEALRASLEITAPFAGRIGALLLQPGDAALAGAALVTVVDDAPTTVIAYVDQMWAHRVKPDDRAQLRPSDGSKPRRTGRVTAVGASITEVPVRFRPVPTHPSFCREIYIALDPKAGAAVLPGQAFDVTFSRAKRSQPVARVTSNPGGGEGAEP